MLARLSKSSVKALGLNFPQGSITASTSSGASDGDELVIDLDLLQFVRPVQDLARLLDGCGRTFAPVWNNIQNTLSYDVEQWALLLLELEEDYDDDGEDDEGDMDYTVSGHPELITHPTIPANTPLGGIPRHKQKPLHLYGERPPRIQRNSSYIVRISGVVSSSLISNEGISDPSENNTQS
ncbi:hypothetical protein AAF712_002890 [Marasmius tenuissimus]|uniref:Uncharacterized protein n=1 Tax=Marasmius tenuissimus TaxID=585030 RepID=A0ABR3AAF4_9AGAR